MVKQKLFLVTAESCTGGLLSNLITDIPGSSDYYIGGVSTYSYGAKKKLLNVKESTLSKYGAVSAETVKEMAMGVRKLFHEDVSLAEMLGISISGIAGPGGGMPGKPVGLVWVGFSAGDETWAFKRIWTGDRKENKLDSTLFALEVVSAFLDGNLATIVQE